MARLCFFLVLTATLLCSASAQSGVKPNSNVTLASLGPAKLSVNLTYMIDGQRLQLAAPCMEQAPGSACLPQVQAARDSIIINYAVLPQFTANTSDTVMLRACYSNFSSVDRPWRAAIPIIALSRRCPFIIKQQLNPSSGNATWKVPNNVPMATFFVRALVYNGLDAVAVGNSAGYFEVNKISIHPKGLVTAAGLCICVGPLLFTALMLWEFKFAKKRV